LLFDLPGHDRQTSTASGGDIKFDPINFQGGDNIFPVHITLNPNHGIGFVNGPDLTTAIQSFSY
jgi:hypothetical protein